MEVEAAPCHFYFLTLLIEQAIKGNAMLPGMLDFSLLRGTIIIPSQRWQRILGTPPKITTSSIKHYWKSVVK